MQPISPEQQDDGQRALMDWIKTICIVVLTAWIIASTYVVFEWAVRQRNARDQITSASIKQLDYRLAVVKAEMMRQARILEEAKRVGQ